jgi:hypothetical protein
MECYQKGGRSYSFDGRLEWRAGVELPFAQVTGAVSGKPGKAGTFAPCSEEPLKNPDAVLTQR